MFTSIQNFLGLGDNQVLSSDEESDLRIDGQQSPVIQGGGSKVQGLDFGKRIPVKPIGKGNWDFLTLYKALLYSIHNENMPKRVNGYKLSFKKLKLDENKDYKKEMVEMKKLFDTRYQKLQIMKKKIDSLKFIKNSNYMNIIKELKETEEELTPEFIEKIKYLFDSSENLTEEEKADVERYSKLTKKIKLYKTKIIGKGFEIMEMVKRKKLRQQNMLDKIKKLNKADTQAQYQKIILEKEYDFVDEDNKMLKEIFPDVEYKKENFYLKSKMIYHLKRFMGVTHPEAELLLEDGMYNKLINVNMNEIQLKLDQIISELKSYENIVAFVNHLNTKTYLCPYCTFHNHQQINVNLHITQYHGSKIQKQSERDPGFYVADSNDKDGITIKEKLNDLKNNINTNNNEIKKLEKSKTKIKTNEYKIFQLKNKIKKSEKEIKEINDKVQHIIDEQFATASSSKQDYILSDKYRQNVINTTIIGVRKNIKNNKPKIKNIVYTKNIINPLLVIKPIKTAHGYENVYDGVVKPSQREALHHMKTNNKLVVKDLKYYKLDEKIIKKMKPYNVAQDNFDITEDIIEEKEKRIINPDEQEKKLKYFFFGEEDELFGDIVIPSSVPILAFLERMSMEDYEEYEAIKRKINKIIQKAKHFENLSIAYKWVNSAICYHFLEKYFKNLMDVNVMIEYENRQTIKYNNVDNILNKIPRTVTVGDKVIIEDYKMVGENEYLEITPDMIKDKIKTEIFMIKVKQFSKQLANKISKKIKNSSDRQNKRNEIMNEVKIPEIFYKILHKTTSNRNEQGVFESNLDNVARDFDTLIEKLMRIKQQDKNMDENFDIEQYLLNDVESTSKEFTTNIDHYLYYILLSYLPNDDSTVAKTYNILEEQQGEETNFQYKNQVWNWYKKYGMTKKQYTDMLKKENKIQGYRDIQKGKILDKLFQNTDESIVRKYNNPEYKVYNNMYFEGYIHSAEENREKYNEYRKEMLIEKFLYNGLERNIVREIDFKIFMGMMFLNKLYKAIDTNKKSEQNSEVVLRFLRILDLYIEEPKIIKRIILPKYNNKLKKITGNIKKDEDNLRKDDLLNDFMDLNEDQMSRQLNDYQNNNQSYVE